MITDDELLAACREAGEPGTESHRLACRLYRRSVLEWQAGHVRWRREYARRAAARGHLELVTAPAPVLPPGACPCGREYDHVDAEGKRRCSECRRRQAREAMARYRARKKAAAGAGQAGEAA